MGMGTNLEHKLKCDPESQVEGTGRPLGSRTMANPSQTHPRQNSHSIQRLGRHLIFLLSQRMTSAYGRQGSSSQGKGLSAP